MIMINKLSIFSVSNKNPMEKSARSCNSKLIMELGNQIKAEQAKIVIALLKYGGLSLQVYCSSLVILCATRMLLAVLKTGD